MTSGWSVYPILFSTSLQPSHATIALATKYGNSTSEPSNGSSLNLTRRKRSSASSVVTTALMASLWSVTVSLSITTNSKQQKNNRGSGLDQHLLSLMEVKRPSDN